MRLLLISNSGKPYLGHCRDQIATFLGRPERALFVAEAAFLDPHAYLAKVREALASVNIEPTLLDLENKPVDQLDGADAILVGGGNTYRLLQRLRDANVLAPMARRVQDGMAYVGWSAGANLTAPTILTTNDWNVVGLNSFDALNLVPFNINPHYLETDITAAPHAETRDDRIAEYHCANSNMVLGIEEQTMIVVENGTYTVAGRGRVRRFEPNQKPVDYKSGAIITF